MNRSFLFLQGPHGPFFGMLGKELARCGHRVARVNFNGGDWYDWKGPGAIRFSGALSGWEDFCGGLLSRHQVTDLVVYGDCRPVHAQAIRLARSQGVQVHVFEEGYIRPDWVTLEQGGVNGHSGLPREAEWYLHHAAALKEQPHVSVGPSMRPRVYHCIDYYVACMALRSFFPAYRSHRPCHPLREARLWVKSFPRLQIEKRRALRQQDDLLASGKPYFFVCLQLSDDSQIAHHSRFASMQEFIATVIDSFSRHAPADTSLVFKNHPLDPGGFDYRAFIAGRSAALGLEGRFLYLENGQLPVLIRGSEGVVLVNSTVGTSALFHRRPTIALGESVYNFAGLTFQGGLDAFWQNPVPPDRAVFQAFRSYLLQNVLVNGCFYNPDGRARLLAGVLPRLSGAVAPAGSGSQTPVAVPTFGLAPHPVLPKGSSRQNLAWRELNAAQEAENAYSRG